MTPIDLTGIESTYAAAGYGAVLYGLVRVMQPKVAVELGTYQGYSGLHIAAGVRENDAATVCLVDLWDKYLHRHCSLDVTRQNFARNGFRSLKGCNVVFCEEDAVLASCRFADGSVDFLHVDLANDGLVLAEVFEVWEPRLSSRALVVIEGGSTERDAVEWMGKYNKEPIGWWLNSPWVLDRFSCLTLEPFPSMTLMRRR